MVLAKLPCLYGSWLSSKKGFFFLVYLVALFLTKLEGAVMPTLCQLALYIPNFVVVVQLLSHVQLFATPWTAARQASLSFTISWSLLKLMSMESMMSSNHLLLHPSPPPFNLSQHQGLFQTLVIRISEVPSLFLLHECFQTMY